jgi:hypothetical protein
MSLQQSSPDLNLEEARRAHDRIAKFQDNTNEATIKAGDGTLRTFVIINGGAAVSVLAFIGGLVSQDRIKISDLKDISSSLMFFAFGVAAAGAAMGLSYFTNYVNTMHAASQMRTWQHPYVVDGAHSVKFHWWKTGLHILAVAAAIASLVLFICGMVDVRNSIMSLPTPKTP